MKKRKTIASVSIAAILAAGVLSAGIYAEDTNKVYLVSDAGSVNDTVSVSVVIDSDTYQLSGIAYTMNYDPEALELQGEPVLNDIFENGFKLINTENKGSVDVAYAGFDVGASFHDTEVMKLSFKVLKVNSEITINLGELNNYTVDAEDVSGSFTVQNVTVKCSHKNTETKTELEDCEKGGKTITACKDCSETVKTEDIAPAEHKVDKWTVTKGATCTENGEEEGVCGICGKTVTRETEMVEHSFGEWAVTIPATCTEKGVETSTCAVCGKARTREIDALGHDFGEWTVVKEAACTEKGTEERVCSRCDEKETRETDMIDHNIEWKVTKEATCTEAGEKTGTCSACGKTEKEEIPALGHDWSEWKTVDEATTEKEGSEERECSRCGEKETRVTDKLEPAPDNENKPADEKPNNGSSSGNPATGVVLAVIPLVAASAAAVIFCKKRK